jgi:ferrous iron transport protein B
MGLPGKAFVPLIIGFGCNVPAIMATRTLENKRDRILAIMMSPFMSCSARMAIFAVFTAAFFPVGGQNIVFALYFIGITMAIFTGWFLRRTVLPGELTPFIMELPSYHLPSLKTLLMQTWNRLKTFLFRAGKLIVPICMLIGSLNAIKLDKQNSVLSYVGKKVTPLFSPMGIRQSNWPATVGLLTGTLSKEIVIATLNTLYSEEGHLTTIENTEFHFCKGMREALYSIPENFKALPGAFSNPLSASAKQLSINAQVYGYMYQQFGGKVGAFAYLLFILLYVPCASTMAVITKELNARWMVFSVVWSTGLAYAAAVLFYQMWR